jgi:hypothetical protein
MLARGRYQWALAGRRPASRGGKAAGFPWLLEDLSLEQEDPGIAVLTAVDGFLNDCVAVL